MKATPKRPIFGEMPWVVTQRKLDELEAVFCHRFDELGGNEMKLQLDKLAEAVHGIHGKIAALEAKVADLEAENKGAQAVIDKLTEELADGASEGGITV